MQDRDGDGQIVYLFLPFYKRGNLQDVINSNSVNGRNLPEREMLRLFRGTCLAVRAMHTYRSTKKSSQPERPTHTIAPPSRGPSPTPAMGAPNRPDHDVEDEQHESEGLLRRAEDDHDDQGAHPHPDDDGEGEGFTYSGSNMPLTTKKPKLDTRLAEVIFDQDEFTSAAAPSVEGELIPYAHRDLKPA